MTIDILTLFPKMFTGPFAESIVKRAQDKGLVKVNLHDLRIYAIDKRGTVDDRPYGGGVGMILRIEPIWTALQNIVTNFSGRIKMDSSKVKIVLTDPRGKKFTQAKAREYAKLDQLVLLAGHYEGVDERVREHLVDESISIGNYILTGGEIPAMVIADAVTRLIPGVLEKPEAIAIESFSATDPELPTPNLEYPQYTRPEEFNGWKVPTILLSGNHTEINKWRRAKQ